MKYAVCARAAVVIALKDVIFVKGIFRFASPSNKALAARTFYRQFVYKFDVRFVRIVCNQQSV